MQDPTSREKGDSGICTPTGLKVRRDYLRVAATGRKWITPGVIVQYRPPHTQKEDRDDTTIQCRVGITVSRKVGGAVVRNRVKRRLREIIRGSFPKIAQRGADYVLVVRAGADSLEFDRLISDLKWALKKLHSGADLTGRADRPRGKKPGKHGRK